MANNNTQPRMEIGILERVTKTYTDQQTGVTREYFGYEVVFPNGTAVRFAPLSADRSLLSYLMKEMTS